MSGKGGSGGKSVTSSGTNGQGNTYTNYSDGGYRLVAFGSISVNNGFLGSGTATLPVPATMTLERDILSTTGDLLFNFLMIYGSSCSGSQGTQGSGGVPYSTHTNQNQGYSTTKYK